MFRMYRTGHRGINSSTNTMKPTKKSGDDSQSRSRPNEMMKTPALRKSKYYINSRQDKTKFYASVK